MLCLKVDFYYYMYGASMGSLQVKVYGENFEAVVGTITGNQGQQWLKFSQEVDVPSNQITVSASQTLLPS
jgi:hypothetical protein